MAVNYYFSAVLNKRYKHDTETGAVTVEDPPRHVTYNADEVRIIKDTIGEITPGVHAVKKVMEGEIICRTQN